MFFVVERIHEFSLMDARILSNGFMNSLYSASTKPTLLQNILYAYKMFETLENRIRSLQNVLHRIFFVLLPVSWAFMS